MASDRQRWLVTRQIVLSFAALGLSHSLAAASFDVVVPSNTPAPEGDGVLVLGSAPSLNDAGRIAFASLVTGTADGSDDVGIYRLDPPGIVKIARTGETLVGRTITGYFPSFANIDDNGRVSAVATFSSPFGAWHFVGDGGSTAPLYEPASSSPSGNNTLLGVTTVVTNSSGTAAYIAAYSGANPEVGVYSRSASGAITTHLLRNSTAPRGGTVTSVGNRLTLNESSQIAAVLDIDGTTIDSLARLEGSTVQELARQGDLASDGVTTIGSFSANTSFVSPQMPIINDGGKIAFTAQYQAGFRVGAFLASDEAPRLVIPGALPQGNANAMNLIGINASGGVAAAVQFSGGADPLSAVYLGDAAGQLAVAIEDREAPVPGKFFRSFSHEAAALNEAGQLVFLAELSDSVDGPLSGRGLFIYDPAIGITQIARSGDATNLGAIRDIYFAGTMMSISSQSPDISRSGLNQAGDVAFMYELDSGALGIGLWSSTPPVVGDFDDNGLVDGADLTLWHIGYGDTEATLAEGDANGDQNVDGADFLLWQQHLTGPSQVQTSLTPEPAAFLLVSSGLTALSHTRRSSQAH